MRSLPAKSLIIGLREELTRSESNLQLYYMWVCMVDV